MKDIKNNKHFSYMKWLISMALFGCILLFAMIPIRDHNTAFHTSDEWENYLRNWHVAPPEDLEALFPTANQCKGCHGPDPQMNAMIDAQGNDVNVHDDWSTSMMANSAKDPFWKAKVSHEVMVNPDHKLDLETKCTSCHAPQGHFTVLLRGGGHYTMENLKQDSVGLDGVSCGACHMKAEEDLEKLFSGEANYDTSGVMFGPYPAPFAAPMNSFVGFDPVYSEHINSSGICASCHTLFTKSVDLEGDFTGESFAEQATYHEWINSDFDDDGESPQSCQSCHMPRLFEGIVISANYLFLDPRSPYGLHDLIGANVPMIQLMQQNKEALDIDAADEHFEETIEKILEMLQEKSLDLDLKLAGVENDTLSFDVDLKNKAGHKFPSGYPSRRLYVEFVLWSEFGEKIFHSGQMNDAYQLVDYDAAYEPHYDEITDESEVQVYEYVLGDVSGEVTTVLERAYVGLKDNRIPPQGFTKSHAVYDTTRILGNAEADQNFNIDAAGEGSGTDRLTYRIALDGYRGDVFVVANVYYQAVPPRWLEEMFAYESDEINDFKQMFENADMSPTLVATDSILDLNIKLLNFVAQDFSELSIYPNPSSNGIFTISSDLNINNIIVFDRLGNQVIQKKDAFHQLDLAEYGKGLYIVKVLFAEGEMVKKVIVQ